MSVYKYDNAIVNKLRELTNDSRIYVTPPDNVIRTIGQIDSDKIELPLISVARTGYSILDSRSHPMKFEGSSAGYNEDLQRFVRFQMIPIRINYLMDVWTKHREENDNIIRELVFYFSTHPTIKVPIGYGLNFDHNFNLILDSQVEDNSDIVEHKNRGEYFRQTLSMYTDDAYLWKSSSRGPTYISGIKTEIYSNDHFVEEEVYDFNISSKED